ncbi:MAG: type IX secretion system membrane protein PorP/SprF [Flavobacteriaceae bacterium]
MSCNTTTPNKILMLIAFFVVLGNQASYGQETVSNLSSSGTYHNQLFFNRFLINPTFSLVRENKSYLNILHRNQYASFEDNSQNYFLGFSNQLNDHTALGIGVFSQWSGVIQEFGFNANYATSVQLGSKSKLTFGANITYFNVGLDKNRVIATENDPKLLEAKKESKIAIQPAITLSLGKFDFGLYAENLFKYNQTTNDLQTNLSTRSIKASFQYTHSFETSRGLFTNARLMPLVQLGKNKDGSMAYVGSLLLDLPKYGWLQSTLDDQYGLSMGFGFNLNKKMSIGYLMEKDVFEDTADFGWNHELSLAYTFENHSAALGDYVDSSEDNKIDRIVRNYEEQILRLIAEKDKSIAENKTKEQHEIQEHKAQGENENTDKPIEEPHTLAYQNRLILDELILRQDSIESARSAAFEKKFEAIVRVLRNDIRHTITSNSNSSDYKRVKNSVLMASKTEPKTSKNINTIEHKNYVKLPIKVLNQSDIIGVKTGYYVIANVYKSKKYLKSFMNALKKQGLDAKQFYNKENGLHYVYLADFNFKKDAETAYISNLNGRYRDEKWIMQIDNTLATVANTFEE